MFKIFKKKNKIKSTNETIKYSESKRNNLVHLYPDTDDYITVPIDDFKIDDVKLGFIHKINNNILVRNIGQYEENLSVVCEDISRVKCDAVVNAAKSSLLGGGGVDGAIHMMAGRDLEKECKTLNGCECGNAKITNGYNMYVKKIIHAVGPQYKGGKYIEAELLKSAYENAFNLAVTNNLKTVAFPAISCGIYGFPINEGLKIALNVVQDYLMKYPDMHFIFVVNSFCFDEIVKILNEDSTLLKLN